MKLSVLYDEVILCLYVYCIVQSTELDGILGLYISIIIIIIIIKEWEAILYSYCFLFHEVSRSIGYFFKVTGLIFVKWSGV